jgi:hypothetical protein
MSTADLVAGGVCILLLILLIVFVVRVSTGNSLTRSGGTGFLTGFQDLQPKDKQEAIETIIREHAGKREFADGANAAPGKAGTPHESE